MGGASGEITGLLKVSPSPTRRSRGPTIHGPRRGITILCRSLLSGTCATIAADSRLCVSPVQRLRYHDPGETPAWPADRISRPQSFRQPPAGIVELLHPYPYDNGRDTAHV